ncbi:MAG: YbaB/EbfC family nucleoid-associated protein [Gammaproteobacteria bacterium]|nr:YbaB/EbfC family nucleoid-associated protein [Gammaproteobacteria bacterium]MCH9743444.1 YbaB/EbfC family nucleoid-associated protein [Gammaproteobacteria bacterium]
MLGDKFNLGSLLKNAKKMQEMMEETQTELANTEVSGESGAGAVKVVMTARHQIKVLDIDDSIIKEDKAVLQELIIAALNDANQKVEKITQAKMMDASKLFGGKTDSE